jgi:hypothetical protein
MKERRLLLRKVTIQLIRSELVYYLHALYPNSSHRDANKLARRLEQQLLNAVKSQRSYLVIRVTPYEWYLLWDAVQECMIRYPKELTTADANLVRLEKAFSEGRELMPLLQIKKEKTRGHVINERHYQVG